MVDVIDGKASGASVYSQGSESKSATTSDRNCSRASQEDALASISSVNKNCNSAVFDLGLTWIES